MVRRSRFWGLGESCETDPHQVELRVPAIDLATQYALESLSPQGLERVVAGLAFKARFGEPVEPRSHAFAVVGCYGGKEPVDQVFGARRGLLLAGSDQGSDQSGESPGRTGKSQVPGQDGANSSSSEAEMNSSLHQNDTREWPLRTH